MRDIAITAYDVGNKVYDLVVLPLFVVMVASVVIAFFVGDGFGHDLFRYVLQPLGMFVIVRWVGRWAWRRYHAARASRVRTAQDAVGAVTARSAGLIFGTVFEVASIRAEWARTRSSPRPSWRVSFAASAS